MTDSSVSPIDAVAATIFALALVHTFAAPWLARRLGGRLHALTEVEWVFASWAVLLLVAIGCLEGPSSALRYAASRSYVEPLFVVVVMLVAASRPVLRSVAGVLDRVAVLMPFRTPVARAWLGLAAVPLLGSLIAEPAAMTLAAAMLAPQVFRPDVPARLKYLALGVLFVDVSIGGTLTAFAAPPVLMVAGTWQWDSLHMARAFGWKAALAVLLNASLATFLLRRHLRDEPAEAPPEPDVPPFVVAVHVALLAGVVAFAHRPVAVVTLLAVFLAFARATRRHQSPLIVGSAFGVGAFLAGLVVLGGLQTWWLQPAIASLSPGALFASAVGLTAVVDNAALTYLGSQIGGLADLSKYLLVAGAVAGGGLTVIANAPNPAGAALLRRGFDGGVIGTGGLLLGALVPTLVAAAAFVLP